MKFLYNTVFKNSLQLYRLLFENSHIKKAVLSANIKKVLDVGLGTGLSTKAFLSFKNVHIEGLDIHYDLLPEYQKEIKVVTYDGTVFPYKDNSFDLIIISFVLHHCNDQRLMLSEAKRVSSQYILVFEELKHTTLQHFFMKLYDFAINLLIFRHPIQLPVFKSDKEWEELFKEIHVNVAARMIVQQNMLVTRVAYLLDTKKS